MSDATKDSINNLPSEEDGDSVKLQKVDDASKVQHTAKFATMKNQKKKLFIDICRLTKEEEETKNPLNC